LRSEPYGSGARTPGTNTYSGGTQIDGGVLALESAGSLGPSGTISFGGGTLRFSASNTSDYSNRFSTAASQTISIDTNGQSVTFASALTSSGGTLAKSGAGNLILSGASTYTGATSLSAGRLSVNGSLGNTAVAVSGGELGGSGSIGGTVSVASGGTLAPGNSIESLAAGATTFAAGSTFAYEVDSSAPLASAADLLVVTGNLDLDAGDGTLLTFTDLSGSPTSFGTTTFALINYTGTWNGGLFTYGGSVLADDSQFTVGSQDWVIDYNASTGGSNFTTDYAAGSFVTVTAAVPEPTAITLLGIGVGVGLVARRRLLSR
jgi:autotransporter-associated beta strand protein